MTTNIFLPPTLTKWTEGRVTAILQASTQDIFNEVFDEFLSQDVNITANGCPVSRDDYKAQLQSQSALNQRSATVKFDAAIEVPDNQELPKQSGLVSVFFDAIIAKNSSISGEAVKHRVTSALNVVIKPDAAVIAAGNPGVKDYFDVRRVSVLNQVFTDNPVPIQA